MTSSSLIQSLQFVLDTENKEVYNFLQYLDQYANVSAENKSLKVQRLYTIRWCILSQFLYENRHHNFVIPADSQLKFIVHFTDSATKCSTSVHWYQSFYQVDLLSKQLLQAITMKTGSPALGNKVKSGLILSLTQEETKECTLFVRHSLETLALLNLCIHMIDTACISFKDQPVVTAFKLRMKWLTFVSVWLRATTLLSSESDENQLLTGFRMLQGCILFLGQESGLLQDEFIGSLEKQLRIQMYLAGAKYYQEEGKQNKAGFCYSKAVQQGWKADEAAAQLLAEDDIEETVELELDQPQKKPEDLIKSSYFTGICQGFNDSKLKLRPCKQQ
jgi:hypothetical protein